MFNVDITSAERKRLIEHFTKLLKAEAVKERIVERDMVLDCLNALRLLEDVQATASEGEE